MFGLREVSIKDIKVLQVLKLIFLFFKGC